MRTILTSKAFYSDTAIGSQIKSPLQLVIGTIRQLELPMPPPQRLMGPLTQMGQVPFAPPNVRGWPGGRMWINTSTLFVRYNTGLYLAGNGAGEFAKFGNRKFGVPARNGGSVIEPPVNFQPGVDQTDSQTVVDNWVNRLIQRPIADDKRQVLVDALGDQPAHPDKLRAMVQLIMSMPEYQLC